MDNEEKGYEVVDKRANREAQSSEKPNEVAEEQAPEPETEQENGTGDVYSLLQWIIMMLSQSAWQWMGLQMNPFTKKVDRDLAQAKTAVDSVAFLVDQVTAHVSEEQMREYRALVNDLRVNFVQQSRTD
jgi:hypothetical protein